MKKVCILVMVACFTALFNGSVFCHGTNEAGGQYDYGFGWEFDPVIRHAMGRGYVHGPGWDLSVPGWYSMSRENSERLQKERDVFQKETLVLRQKLVSAQMELSTLWAQRKPDTDRIETLLNDVATLQSELLKKRGLHLIKCRRQFGGEHWACPGLWMETETVE